MKQADNHPTADEAPASTAHRYRPDIDGLRAIAVLSVVAFHAFPSIVKGGFVGVDVFFVISGFLISGILLDSLTKESFSLKEFYARRIKRIFPALILVLGACGLLGWFVLLADEYKHLGSHLAGGAFFVSNLLLLKEANYFDISSDSKPLLHLWSLGVEEQFYILWPVLLWLAFRVGLNPLKLTLAAIATSFGLCVIGTHDSTAMFYSPATRFWELGVGSLLACMAVCQTGFDKSNSYLRFFFRERSRTLQECMSASGLFLILAAVFFLSRDRTFPGWWALFPTVGAALLISAGPSTWINRTLLSARVMVWFGLISFPLYLWHWPLLSFLRIVEGGQASTPLRLCAVILSGLLAWLTYRLLEKNLRFRKSPWVIVLLSASMVAVALFGYSTMRNDGYASRAVNQNPFGSSQAVGGYTERKQECFDVERAHSRTDNWFCHLNHGEPKVFVTGDSHALSLLPAFETVAKDVGVDILFTGFSGCPPLLNIYARRGDQDVRNCKLLNERIFNYVSVSGIKDLYLVARWTYYTDGRYDGQNFSLIASNLDEPYTLQNSRLAFQAGLRETVMRYKKADVRVHVVRDIPIQLQDGKDFMRKVAMSSMPTSVAIEKFSISREKHQALQSFVNAEIDRQDVDVINLDEVYCQTDVCPFAAPDRIYYLDSDHLNRFGAALAVQPLLREINRQLTAPQSGAVSSVR